MRWRWLLRLSLPFSPEMYFDTVVVVDRPIDSFSSLARNFTWIHTRLIHGSITHIGIRHSAFGGPFMLILRKIYIQINSARPCRKIASRNFTLEFSGRLACVALNWRSWRHFSNDSWNFVLKRKRSKYTMPPPQQQQHTDTCTTLSRHIYTPGQGRTRVRRRDRRTAGEMKTYKHLHMSLRALALQTRTAQKDKPNKNQNKAATKAKQQKRKE